MLAPLKLHFTFLLSAFEAYQEPGSNRGTWTVIITETCLIMQPLQNLHDTLFFLTTIEDKLSVELLQTLTCNSLFKMYACIYLF